MALFVAVLVIAFAVRVVDVLLLVVLAALCAVYLAALTDLLERRARFPRWAGLTAAVVGTLALIAGIGALILPPVIDQTQSLVAGLPDTLTRVQDVLARWAREYPVLRRSELANPQAGLVAGLIDDATAFLRSSLVPYLRAGGTLFIDGASVVVMALYLARAPGVYRDGLVSLVPPRYRDLGDRIVADAAVTLRAWVGGQLLAMLVLGALTTLGLLVLGVPYWLAFGVFTGVATIVPFFGSLVSTLLPAIFVIGEGDWVKVVAVLLLGVVVHLVEGNFVGPLIMERKISLPPVLTIASVLVMGTLLGIVGLVVAVPVLAVTMVLVRHVLHGEVYGERGALEHAVLVHTGEFRAARRRSAD